MTKKSDPALDEAQVADDTVAESHEAACERAGLDPEKTAPDDPALTGIPRDERHDSIDPHTGLHTEEAQGLRREAAEAGASER